jgi:ABC-2 type transport system ATP-binding protein
LTAVVEVEDLCKVFRVRKATEGRLAGMRRIVAPQQELRHAVAGVSFSIDRGEIVGYIGPNGAGKSTTVKCLTGILRPTSGHVSLNGLTPWRQRIATAQQIGVVFGQKTALWWDVPLLDTLKLLKEIYNVPTATFDRNVQQLDEILGVREFFHVPVRQLSLGQRVRADLTAALIHGPQILFLDEPTIGLDVSAKASIRTLLKRIAGSNGVTILLTTHDMADIQRLCDRLFVIDHGKVIFEGSIGETIRHFAPERHLIVELLTPARSELSLGHATVTTNGDLRRLISFEPNGLQPVDLIRTVMDTYEVRDFKFQEPDIEEIVRGIYDRSSG